MNDKQLLAYILDLPATIDGPFASLWHPRWVI